jgi:hypothetical protein
MAVGGVRTDSLGCRQQAARIPADSARPVELAAVGPSRKALQP